MLGIRAFVETLVACIGEDISLLPVQQAAYTAPGLN
ncbi:hypothetical protein IWX87_000137 [Polaromonas sp. CG_9.7]|nr:hypothetical protein [Polaromonas sp. CG_9.7]MBG6112395.1 hypothetical protein [Polaromonas sp. CG_9.2]MDH6184042.1 hypothetical protein [Polaromonas sp. CG_23.6]